MSPSSTATTVKAAGRPLKNPLRVASVVPFPAAAAAAVVAELPPDPPAPVLSGQQLRQMEISQFIQWLRTQTNKHKRPFSERAIEGYAETARVLDRWMTEQDIDADFTACDVALLNQFFAGYLTTHSQGGTNTRQRNLHHLFKWLAKTRGHPDPWTTELVRYGPSEVPPWTLAMELIKDLHADELERRPAGFGGGGVGGTLPWSTPVAADLEASSSEALFTSDAPYGT